MGMVTTRVSAIATYLLEIARHGLPAPAQTAGDEVLFVLDGVGGFQFAPVLVRKALRDRNIDLPTIYFRWQYGVPGEIWTDLMWYRRNRVMAARLARAMLEFRRRHPRTPIHLLAFSGGTGIAVFALESLHRRPLVETLILACPALAPEYDLAPALACVRRAYALVSERDTVILGLGTRLFGTIDRRFEPAAGQKGFRRPMRPSGAETNRFSARTTTQGSGPETTYAPRAGSSDEEGDYAKLQMVWWTPELRRLGHNGGHTGWVRVPFLREHLLPLLRGNPRLSTSAVP
ncbi:MAG: hypothetical protein HY763_06700 [Planctomycetes bacterium]|nr:hypothetical protein [Planctomycetota bacterium]